MASPVTVFSEDVYKLLLLSNIIPLLSVTKLLPKTETCNGADGSRKRVDELTSVVKFNV